MAILAEEMGSILTKALTGGLAAKHWVESVEGKSAEKTNPLQPQTAGGVR